MSTGSSLPGADSPASPRLSYVRLTAPSLGRFHSLVVDEHVRRYLMDGEILPREWSEERIRDSHALFERRGVGLWLVEKKGSRELLGFCGFLELPFLPDQPQLVYALPERFAGKGYGTEMARASIDYARSRAGFKDIVAAVDEVNTKSCKLLERIGFTHIKTIEGNLGPTLLYRLQ
jgi:[ribosomal protein S5]-alanine N-acetyltransferase